MRRVLFCIEGEIGFATTIGRHREDVAALRARLADDNPPSAVIAHTGFGLHKRLPNSHHYRQFVFLREPVERTLSNFYYSRDVKGHLDADMTLREFLEDEPLHSHNAQTAFLGGLTIRHHLDGLPINRDHFDDGLLARAKAALDEQEVVGFTDQFDRSLEALRHNFGWPLHRTLYVSINQGRRPTTISAQERQAVRASNELDHELFEYARERYPLPAGNKTFAGANRVYRRVHPVVQRARGLARTRAIHG